MKEFIEEQNIDLKKYNTYKIGGTAKYLIKPKNPFDLKSIFDELNKENIPYLILGGGSNVILPDEDFNGAIIKLDNFNDISFKDDYCFAGAGISLNQLIKTYLDNNFVNLSKLYGIPGTLGGAIRGNAGCYNDEIFNHIKSVLVYDDGYIKFISKENISYPYRDTSFKHNNMIILGAILYTKIGDANKEICEIKERFKERINKQPLEYPNAGSVFKNPSGVSAGKLIEDCGLKGYQIGGAKVSNKHANFIINYEFAKSSDIISLIEKIKEEVKIKKNIELELEQVVIKW